MMGQLFYIFCTTLPSHIIPFVLFWNFQWRSRRLALALVTVNVLCKMAAAAYFIIFLRSYTHFECIFSLRIAYFIIFYHIIQNNGRSFFRSVYIRYRIIARRCF